MLFTSKKISKDRVIVLDIGSSTVRGALVNFSDGLSISHAIRRHVKFEHDKAAQALLASIRDAALLVTDQLYKKSQGKVSEVYCFFSTPWYVSQITTLTKSFQKAQEVSRKMIDELRQAEFKRFRNEAAAEYQQEFQGNLHTLEAEILNYRLNGYPTTDPFGHRVNDLSVDLFLSIIPQPVIEEIEEAISQRFHPQIFHYHTFTSAAYQVHQKYIYPHGDFLSVDVGGELTDILLVENRSLKLKVSFDMGTRDILESVATKLSQTPSQIASQINLLESKDLDETSKNQLLSALTEPVAQWKNKCQKAMEEIAADNLPLNHIVYLDSLRESDVLLKPLQQVINLLISNVPATREISQDKILSADDRLWDEEDNHPSSVDATLMTDVLYVKNLIN